MRIRLSYILLLCVVLLTGVSLVNALQGDAEATLPASDSFPAYHDDFRVNVNQGRPSVILSYDPNTEWIEIYMGSATEMVEMKWYNLETDAICNDAFCEIILEANPLNGAYELYLRPWGNGRFVNEDPAYWAGPVRFEINFQPPNAPANLDLLDTDGNRTFIWDASIGATWYEVWVGTLSPFESYFSSWIAAHHMGCGNLGRCSITPNVNLPNGQSLEWYVRAWGPGGLSVNGDSDGWARGVPITTDVVDGGSDGGSTLPTYTGFGLGGQVDWFEYPHHMREANMTWVKKQIKFSMGDSTEFAESFIQRAYSQGYSILLGVVGDQGQLASNREAFIAEYSAFVGRLAGLMTQGGAIEVWNEPNIEREWPASQISGAAYVDMLRPAYTAIKSVNPNVMVISAAPAPTGVSLPGIVVPDDNYIREMAGAGAGNYLDCVGVHYNEGAVPPSATSGDPRMESNHYSRYFPSMVALYSSVFPGKDLCFTELGYVSADGLPRLPDNFAWASHITVEAQANWLAEVAQMSRDNPRIRMVIIWNVDFTYYGIDPMAGYAIVRPDGTCPACQTLGRVISRDTQITVIGGTTATPATVKQPITITLP